MGDCDIGETFLNFLLDVHLREHAGVDLTEMLEGSRKKSMGKMGTSADGFQTQPIPYDKRNEESGRKNKGEQT